MVGSRHSMHLNAFSKRVLFGAITPAGKPCDKFSGANPATASDDLSEKILSDPRPARQSGRAAGRAGHETAQLWFQMHFQALIQPP